jgi:AcrR family transcriptional regulator
MADGMTSQRRIGTPDSATRHALLDAALHLMLHEGYASVTSRKVAAKAGLKPQLVHYYFRTMDDLFLALVHRGGELSLERQERAFASPTPLRALWTFSIDPAGATLSMEFSALGNHRKAIRAELAAYADRYRQAQGEGLARVLEGYGVDLGTFPLEATSVFLTSLAQILVMEDALGLTRGHAEMLAAVEGWMARYEPVPAEPHEPVPAEPGEV